MKDHTVRFVVLWLFVGVFLISKLLGIEMASGVKKLGRNEVCGKDKGQCDTKFECRERKDGKEKGSFFCLPKPKPK